MGSSNLYKTDWKNWVFDLSKLISDEPSTPERSSVPIDGQLVLIEPNPHANSGKHTISDTVSWMEAFSKYLAVLVSTKTTSRMEAAGLVDHMYQVVRLSWARGLKWLKYDTKFSGIGSGKIYQAVEEHKHANLRGMPTPNVWHRLRGPSCSIGFKIRPTQPPSTEPQRLEGGGTIAMFQTLQVSAQCVMVTQKDKLSKTQKEENHILLQNYLAQN